MAELVSCLLFDGDTVTVSKIPQEERVPWLEIESSYWWVRISTFWNQVIYDFILPLMLFVCFSALSSWRINEANFKGGRDQWSSSRLLHTSANGTASEICSNGKM